MKVLSIVGTLAMFLVGGGIVVHGIAPLHHAIEHWSAGLGGVMASTLPVVANWCWVLSSARWCWRALRR